MTARAATRRRTATALFGMSVVLLAVSLALTTLQLLSGGPLPPTVASPTSGLIFVAAGLVFCVVGALIARRQPGNTIGWLVLVVGTCFSVVLVTSTYVDWTVANQPESIERAAWVNALFGWTWVPAVGLMATFVVLLFPDGRLPGPGWRWLAWASGLVIAMISLLMIISPAAFSDTALQGVANPLAVALPIPVTGDDVFLVLLACIVASAVAAVMRYRRAGGLERHQLKWLAGASCAFVAFFCFGNLTAVVTPSLADDPVPAEVINHLLPVAFCAFPLAIAAAVLRYRLYEIDVVISRTIVVAALSTFITIVYVAIVVGIGQLVDVGDEPNLALSLTATAVVAVAFQPVRERVRRWANRLVYGERATPYEVLSRFADRMGGTYDASQLVPVMARTVGQGTGAARVDIWLRGDEGFVRAASWPGEAVVTSPGSVASLAELSDERVVPVRHGDDLLGGITLTMRAGEALAPAEDRLLAEVAAQAGLVLRNVRLIEDLRASRRRLVAAQDEERLRLERNLHDGAQQSLVALTLMLRMTRSRVTGARAGATLDRAGDELQQAIIELRELARGIYPAVLAERGLGPALTSLAERSAIPVVVEDRVSGRLPADVERTFYFVAAEALAGAQASEIVDIRVARPEAAATLEITGVPDTGDDMIWLRDRVAVVDGTVTQGDSDGGPLVFTVPVPAEHAAPQRPDAAVAAAGVAS